MDLRCAWLEYLDVGSDGAVLTRRGRTREAQGGGTLGLAMPDAVSMLPTTVKDTMLCGHAYANSFTAASFLYALLGAGSIVCLECHCM